MKRTNVSNDPLIQALREQLQARKTIPRSAPESKKYPKIGTATFTKFSIYENNIEDYLPSDYRCTPDSQYISPYSIRVINESRAKNIETPKKKREIERQPLIYTHAEANNHWKGELPHCMSKQAAKCIDFVPDIQVISNEADFEAAKELCKRELDDAGYQRTFVVTPVDWQTLVPPKNMKSGPRQRLQGNKKIDSRHLKPIVDMNYPEKAETTNQEFEENNTEDPLSHSMRNGYYKNRFGRVKCRETRIWEENLPVARAFRYSRGRRKGEEDLP